MPCGSSTSGARCPCPLRGYCNSPISGGNNNSDGQPLASGPSPPAVVPNDPVPWSYIQSVYGETPPSTGFMVEIGSLEMLYSAMSIAPPPADETSAVASLDIVRAVFQGGQACYLLTGHGDVSCCAVGAMGSSLSTSSFATTQGQLLYNPLFQRPPQWRAKGAANHTWIEVTRWPNRCIRQLMSGANGRMVSTPCDGFVNNVTIHRH